ncbi:bifunctional hydroxy-methylpyrimidine kinase/ hydroxy-phosphomethylpyrimidine kinase [Salinisphaera dokdonensis CL-ES53]|uniref:hydroxymethylpyrimidine kinase n=1 Tax=Salinisphaera dokdonensis CL-ES53 TaxID=1304272 RepID=A0ABV2B1B7_9GAMM
MKRPNILVIAGHDPSGGAGIQADIEAAAANGAHAATVITLLTCQDTTNVHGVEAVDTAFFARCLDTALADMRFDAIKIGVVANVEQVERIVAVARQLPHVPLVVDPVLRAAGGGTLADDSVGQALRDTLFAHADVVTPNAGEARLLCDGDNDIDRCGARLATHDTCALITGGDEGDGEVINREYVADRSPVAHAWPRLPGVFHGSGCTLASAIAAQLAHGHDRPTAIRRAQAYVWRTLDAAFAAGHGQRIPARIQPTPDA